MANLCSYSVTIQHVVLSLFFLNLTFKRCEIAAPKPLKLFRFSNLCNGIAPPMANFGVNCISIWFPHVLKLPLSGADVLSADGSGRIYYDLHGCIGLLTLAHFQWMPWIT